MKKLIPVILSCAMLLAACGSSADSAPPASSAWYSHWRRLRGLSPRRKREHFRCRIFRGSFLCGKHHRRRGRRDRHRRER